MKKIFSVLFFSVAGFAVWFMGNFHIFGVLVRTESLMVPHVILIFINPIYLAVICFYFCRSDNLHFICKNIALSVFAMILSIFIGYAGWGVSSGRFLNPDWGTIYVLKYELLIGCLFYLLLYLGLSSFRCLWRRRHVQAGV